MSKNVANIGREMITLGTYEDYDINDIVEVLQAADDLYHNDQQSFIEDNEYDALRKYAHRLESHHSYFTGVGSAVRGGKVKLPYEMGSLDQVEIGEIEAWVRKHTLTNQGVIITDKLDGTSGMIIFDEFGDLQIAYSRGDGVEGADITRHIRLFKSIPNNVGTKMVVRGEIIFDRDGFQKIQKEIVARNGRAYKNARNMTAGLMNSKDLTAYKDLIFSNIKFVAYEIVGYTGVDKVGMLRQLESVGFEVPHFVMYEGKDLTDKSLANYLTFCRKHTKYEIDGLVIDVNLGNKRSEMNPTRDTLNPAYTIKYKVADASNNAIATVIGVEWNVSKHGYLKPRVKIEPIELVGVTIQHATGFNAKFIYENNIGPGAKIQITRSGDVIPFIQSVVTPAKEPQMPTVDWEWNETNVDATLVEHTEEVTIQQMNDFFASIDAPHLKDGNVLKLYEYGHNTTEKVICLTADQVANVIGENGYKIYEGLRNRLTDIPLYALMGSTNFFGRGVGKRKFKKLLGDLRIQSVDELSLINKARIVLVEGFEDKTATKIIAGMQPFLDWLEPLNGKFITFATVKKAEGGSMKDEKIVFTGFRDAALQTLVEEQGGTMQSAVSSKTTILVSSNPTSNSGKMKKARDLGVRVMGVEEFKELL